ncbi:MAG: hypothetical protein JO235_12820 [Chroococcidiopsidaceae cyanobacterium CP_BM_RX_35]|nr:hypothetical protein [Chroococcidiopsidaceae cyanobacterium CP_BM_RX_35]
MSNNLHQPRTYSAVLGSQSNPCGAFVAQLDLMIRACCPLPYIMTVAEEPVEEVLFESDRRIFSSDLSILSGAFSETKPNCHILFKVFSSRFCKLYL